MFCDCTALTQAPELPATTLSYLCYSYMFKRCTSLTTAPELPATTLDGVYYDGMFINCSSPLTFSDKTFDEVANLIQEQTILGYIFYEDDKNN
jgi:hypothetical protein